MKKLFIAIIVAGLTTAQAAEEVGVKVDATQDTTISIKKGAQATTATKKYSIVEGEHEIVGDKDVTAKVAEKNWKAECSEWKKEFRADNKDNKIISVVCGRMKCDKVGVETTCQSQAKYKMKTLSEE